MLKRVANDPGSAWPVLGVSINGSLEGHGKRAKNAPVAGASGCCWHPLVAVEPHQSSLERGHIVFENLWILGVCSKGDKPTDSAKRGRSRVTLNSTRVETESAAGLPVSPTVPQQHMKSLGRLLLRALRPARRDDNAVSPLLRNWSIFSHFASVCPGMAGVVGWQARRQK